MMGRGDASSDAGDFDRAFLDLVDLGAECFHAGEG